VLRLYVLYASVFWHGEAESLETDFSHKNYRPTAREPGRWVFDFLKPSFQFLDKEK
jgi:hypothetical protein